MSVELTKDADEMICVIYREFLERKEAGESKSKSVVFGDILTLQSTIFPEWYEDDINDTLCELSDKGFIQMYINSSFMLLDSAILYMEKRFPNGLKEVLSIIAQFIP